MHIPFLCFYPISSPLFGGGVSKVLLSWPFITVFTLLCWAVLQIPIVARLLFLLFFSNANLMPNNDLSPLCGSIFVERICSFCFVLFFSSHCKFPGFAKLGIKSFCAFDYSKASLGE